MRNRCNKHLTFFNAATHTARAEKLCRCFTLKSVDKYTKNVRLLVQNVSHAYLPVCVFQEDKYMVKRLDEAPAKRFLGVLSRTKPSRARFCQTGHA